MLPIALIDRVEASIAGIAHAQPPPTNATDQYTLQQTKALSGRSGEDFAVRSVGRQAVAVGQELIPGDIPRMVIRNDDAPLVLRHSARLGADLSGRCNPLASLVSAEHIGAGIRWIRQDTEHPRMGQSPPEQFAIPGAADAGSEDPTPGSAGPRRTRCSPVRTVQRPFERRLALPDRD